MTNVSLSPDNSSDFFIKTPYKKYQTKQINTDRQKTQCH